MSKTCTGGAIANILNKSVAGNCKALESDCIGNESESKMTDRQISLASGMENTRWASLFAWMKKNETFDPCVPVLTTVSRLL